MKTHINKPTAEAAILILKGAQSSAVADHVDAGSVRGTVCPHGHAINYDSLLFVTLD
ncbi:MAG: hypothetical protein U1D25_11475 [Hydrogenophaga sp.]|nr:hypothetical protein [Hydrogenophaga sp.]